MNDLDRVFEEIKNQTPDDATVVWNICGIVFQTKKDSKTGIVEFKLISTPPNNQIADIFREEIKIRKDEKGTLRFLWNKLTRWFK